MRPKAGPPLPDNQRYDLRQLDDLLAKARAFVRKEGCSPIECEWFCREKPQTYFNKIERDHDNIMEMYKKDNHGDPKNPINGRLLGLFFNPSVSRANNGPPSESPYGDTRLKILASKMVERAPNLYFSDFYCVSDKENPHYVQIVMTSPGSEADDFCRKHLIELSSSDNPFFYWTTRDVVKLVAEPSNESRPNPECEGPTDAGEDASRDDGTTASDGETVDDKDAIAVTNDESPLQESTPGDVGNEDKVSTAMYSDPIATGVEAALSSDDSGIHLHEILPGGRLEAENQVSMLERVEDTGQGEENKEGEHGGATKRDLDDESDDEEEKPPTKKPRLDQCQDQDQSGSLDSDGNTEESEENTSPPAEDPAPSSSGSTLDISAQPRTRVVKETTCYVASPYGSRPSYWLELFFTQDVDLKLEDPLTTVRSFGRRSGGSEGLKKNDDCSDCCLGTRTWR